MRPGVTPVYPVDTWKVQKEDRAITAYATARSTDERWHLLDTPVLTVCLTSPLPGVIRVQFTHWAGKAAKGRGFELSVDPEARCPDSIVEETDDAFLLRSGNLTARLLKGNRWDLIFEDNAGKMLTRSTWRGTALIDAPEGRFMREALLLKVGTQLYGLGEQFTPFVKNGQSVDIWNEDAGTATNQAYKCIPFYLTNQGYGVFVNHPERVSFEMGCENVERVLFSVPGESLEYFVIHGPTPKDILTCYTGLTGRPPLPPEWSFGLWLTTSFTTNYDEETVTKMLEGMAQRNLPLHVFHYDCFWMKPFHWCDYTWDREMFPDPEAMLSRLKKRGLKICVWINPYISQLSPLFAEGKEKRYFIRTINGDVWQTDMWQPGMAILDFTNPAAVQWYQDKLRVLVRMGVDTFKTDFGERIPADPSIVYHDGSDPQKMHNLYSYLYNKATYELLAAELGAENSLVFARSGTVGSQKFPVHWGGDSLPTFESMAETLRGGLSLGLCGFGFWSHDIGGFGGAIGAADGYTTSVYKRWVAFGLLSSHSRLHGADTYRVPWLYDEEAVDVLRFFTELKLKLMPYILKTAGEAACSGIPVMRAMFLEFPADPSCAYLDRQYMLGHSLLARMNHITIAEGEGWCFGAVDSEWYRDRVS